jgi:hypothetical protein
MKSGPGAFPEPIEVPAIDEKLEAQMKANCATEEEIDALVDELNLRGAASVSFLVRRNNLLVF